MRILGLDLGTKTLGLAITDETQTIASPYKTLKYENTNELIKNLSKEIENKKIEKMILGLPKNMNNSCGFASKRSLEFKKVLESNFKMPIILIDERLSTKEAENILISTDTKRKKRKEIIDAYAAAIILDTYLKESREK